MKKMEAELKKVGLEKEELFQLLYGFRNNASYTMHEYSNGRVSKAIPLPEESLLRICLDFYEAKKMVIKTILSDIDWVESGGCSGDELYPVTLEAVKLPNGSYYGQIIYFCRDPLDRGVKKEEFVFRPPQGQLIEE
jgi:hypothetical protein